MTVSRRNFLIFWFLALVACKAEEKPQIRSWISVAKGSELKPGWNHFPVERIAVFKAENGDLSAMSLVCTHQTCLLNQNGEAGFTCPCHGSNFSSSGKVLNGPATVDLPRYKVEVNESGDVRVEL